MNMQLKQQGFSVPRLLLILIIIGILGGAGWYVYTSRKAYDKSVNDATGRHTLEAQLAENSKKSEVTSKPIAEKRLSADWLLRESSEASIKVPDGFNVLVNNNDPVNFLLSNDQGEMRYQAGTKARVVGENHKHFGLGLIVSYGSNRDASEVDPNQGTYQRSFKTYDGLDVEVSILEQNDPEAVTTLPYGSKWLKYWIKKDSRYFYVGYIYTGEGIVEIIDEMVNTIVIK